MKTVLKILAAGAFVLFCISFGVPQKASAQAGCWGDPSGTGLPQYMGPPNPNIKTNNGCPTGQALLDKNGNTGTAVSNDLKYIPLEPFPGQTTGQGNFCELLNSVFKFLIYLGAMLAVLFLVLAGITYMISEVVDKRSAARDRIKAAVWGLIILLASWIILNTINPGLVAACSVLNGSTTGIMRSQTSIDLQTAVEKAQLRAECQSSQTRKIQTVAAGDTNLCSSPDRSINLPSCKSARAGSLCCDVITMPTANSGGERCVGFGTSL